MIGEDIQEIINFANNFDKEVEELDEKEEVNINGKC